MRVTKTQLKRIIREEKRKLVSEQIDPEMSQLQKSMADHILEMLHEEQAYTGLDLEDGAVVDALAAALRDAAELRVTEARAGEEGGVAFGAAVATDSVEVGLTNATRVVSKPGVPVALRAFALMCCGLLDLRC